MCDYSIDIIMNSKLRWHNKKANQAGAAAGFQKNMGLGPDVMRKAGRHFLQIPGPSAVPDRILSAIGQQTIDHRGPDFAKVGLRALEGLKAIFKTKEHVFIYPASGTGAWKRHWSTRCHPATGY